MLSRLLAGQPPACSLPAVLASKNTIRYYGAMRTFEQPTISKFSRLAGIGALILTVLAGCGASAEQVGAESLVNRYEYDYVGGEIGSGNKYQSCLHESSYDTQGYGEGAIAVAQLTGVGTIAIRPFATTDEKIILHLEDKGKKQPLQPVSTSDLDILTLYGCNWDPYPKETR